MDPDEVMFVEELVDSDSSFRTDAEDSLGEIRLGAQVLDGPQEFRAMTFGFKEDSPRWTHRLG